jgi:hypothetical protein
MVSRVIRIALVLLSLAGVGRGEIILAGYDPGPVKGAIKSYAFDGSLVSSVSPIGLPTYPGNIAVADSSIYISNPTSSSVGLFDLNTGTAINASFISSLSSPTHLALYGGNLYVENGSSNRISVYNATTGALVTSSLLSTTDVSDFQIYDGKIYTLGNDIGVYDAATGAVINAALCPSVYSLAGTSPTGFAVGSTGIYLSYRYAGKVSLLSISTGNLLSSSFVSAAATEMAIYNGLLYTLNPGPATIGVYDASTGAAVNTNLLNYVPVDGSYSRYNGETYHLAVVPEPAALLLGLLGTLLLGLSFACKNYGSRETVASPGMRA